MKETLYIGIIGALIVSPLVADAFETDQYSNRLVPVADSLKPMDAIVNAAIQDIADNWNGFGYQDNLRFATAVYQRLAGIYILDNIAPRVALDDPRIETLPQSGRNSIFSGASFLDSPVPFLVGVGPTVKVNDVFIGSDKVGHFFTNAHRHYLRYLRGWSTEEILNYSALGERLLWGQLMTGVFSNADLVAEYEGLRFYRSLFEDGIVNDKPAIIRWENATPIVQREFTWADHVNDFWDEALNPSDFKDGLETHLHNRIAAEICPLYEKNTQAFIPENEEELRKRYDFIPFRNTRHNRVDVICESSE